MRRYLWRSLLLIFALILLGLLYWGWSYLRRPSSFPFHHLQVSTPVQYVNAKKIQQLAWANVEGGVFSLNVEKLKGALLQQPWIEKVTIQREWPDLLQINLQEKHPEARWGVSGVLDSQGDIFYPAAKTIPSGLSRINAPSLETQKILSNFQKLSDDLQLLDLQIKTLNVNQRMVYQLTLSNGIVVMIGRQNVLERFQRFVYLYSKIIGEKSNNVVKVDLRYSNGIAVKWKSKALSKK